MSVEDNFLMWKEIESSEGSSWAGLPHWTQLLAAQPQEKIVLLDPNNKPMMEQS